jgi:hypothetical protein
MVIVLETNDSQARVLPRADTFKIIELGAQRLQRATTSTYSKTYGIFFDCACFRAIASHH